MKNKKIMMKTIIAVVFLIIFGTAIFIINDFEKEPLTSNSGQSYEKAKVVDITKDNLQEDGNRYGNQEVVLELKSGEHKGEKVNATSPSGTLFGADCVKGMNVIAIVSATDNTMVVTVFTILFVGGVNNKSFAAIVGTVCGVVIAGISAYAFGKAAGISGYNVSDIENLNYVAQYCELQIGGLLFAGIIISALGAVMDVGMSISSTINEIYEKKPDATVRELFISGIHVGKDMMGTMSNTLILAFVGGSITTLMLNYCYNLPTNQLMNSYNIGIEIMQGISGSLGIVLTVPVTAFVAANWCHSKKKK